jgi:chemotaxis protein CheC
MRTNPEQIDAFRELIDIGVERAARLLNRMCGVRVRLRVPEVLVLEAPEPATFLDRLGASGGDRIAAVQMPYSGAFRGSADLILPAESAAQLVTLLTGEESTELDPLGAATLTEAANVVFNSVLGSMTNLLGAHILYDVPSYVEATAQQLSESITVQDAVLLLAEIEFFFGQGDLGNEEHKVIGKVSLQFAAAGFEVPTERVRAALNAAGS